MTPTIDPRTPDGCLFSYTYGNQTITLSPPVFEIDGQDVRSILDSPSEPVVRQLEYGVREHAFSAALANDRDLRLKVIYRTANDSPAVRFRFELTSQRGRTLTKRHGHDRLTYFSFETPGAWAKEVRFSEFRESVHAFCLDERTLAAPEFEDDFSAMGPMIAWGGPSVSALVAYEHGSQVPDAFLRFRLSPGQRVSLSAAKGNYFAGQPIGPETPFRSIWFQAAAVEGGEADLAAA